MRHAPHLTATLVLIMASAGATIAQDPAPVLIKQPRQISPDIVSSKQASPMPKLELTPDMAIKVGRQVWRNETGGDRDAITAWNTSEHFMSLGIGHFIWFAKDRPARFDESFPEMLDFLRASGATPPPWLQTSPVPPCPWNNRAEFKRNFRAPKMTSLRKFLLDTVGLQAQFLTKRMQGALPKMLATIKTAHEREHLRQQFARIATSSPDLYPLIDYVNFKGEGISPTETYPNARTGEPQGWGLKHVLLEMRGTSTGDASALNAFADAAAFVLTRRIQNNPPNKRWLKGWLARVNTYRRPLP